MFLCLLCMLTALAAPVPVVLPDGEDPDPWAEPLALADLELGDPADGSTGIWIAVDGDQWQIRVQDTAGQAHQLTAQAPTTREERESLAHMLSSLAQAVPDLELPALSAPNPTPNPAPAPVPSPAPAAAAEAPTAPVPAPAPAEPAPVAPVAPQPDETVPDSLAVEPPASEPVRPWSPGGWVRGAAGLAFRDGAGAPTGSLFGGPNLGPARLGLGLTASGPHRIPSAADTRWSNLEGLAGLWFALPQGPSIGAAGGLGRRQYGDLDPVVRGTAGFELGWHARLSEHWDLVPLARVDLDVGQGGLRRTTVVVDGERVGELAPTAVRLELALSPHF